MFVIAYLCCVRVLGVPCVLGLGFAVLRFRNFGARVFCFGYAVAFLFFFGSVALAFLPEFGCGSQVLVGSLYLGTGCSLPGETANETCMVNWEPTTLHSYFKVHGCIRQGLGFRLSGFIGRF